MNFDNSFSAQTQIGGALAIAATPAHGITTHHKIGLAMLVLALSQPLFAQCLGGPEDKRHCIWSLVHRSAGWLCVIGGLINIPLGLEGETNFSTPL